MRFGFLMMVLWVSATNVFGGDVYRWQDESGRVHYGERPPHDQAGEAQSRDNPEPEDRFEHAAGLQGRRIEEGAEGDAAKKVKGPQRGACRWLSHGLLPCRK